MMRWHVASFADGDTHLAIPAEEQGGTVTALCGRTIGKPLAVLDQDPQRCPPDALQACAACATASLHPPAPRPRDHRAAAPRTQNAVLLVRLKRGVVGESRRTVHVVRLPQGNEVSDTLTAYCGEQIDPGKAEMLPELTGMPCNRCLLNASTPHAGELLPGGAR
jgi:hypothetical protein